MLTVSYKHWDGGWIDVGGTNGKGSMEPAAKGNGQNRQQPRNATRSIRGGGEDTLRPAPGSQAGNEGWLRVNNISPFLAAIMCFASLNKTV